MSNVDEAKGRLEKALSHLDAVLGKGAADAGPKAVARIAELEAQAAELKTEVGQLQQQLKDLADQESQARTSYAALEEVADAVNSRLDTAIGGIRSVIEH